MTCLKADYRVQETQEHKGSALFPTKEFIRQFKRNYSVTHINTAEKSAQFLPRCLARFSQTENRQQKEDR